MPVVGAMSDTNYDDAVEVTIILPIQERVKKTNERLEADFTKIESKIHRFPQGLRWIGGEGERYIVPSFVALGPYHHGLPHLKKTEELKHAAAHNFCMKSGHSVEEVYGKVLAVTGEARSLYDQDAVVGFSEDEFAEMMFLDGCFLLHYIIAFTDYNFGCDLLLNRMVLSTGPCMLRDIMLLENQIPWVVLDALMSFIPLNMHSIMSGIVGDCIRIASQLLKSVSSAGDGRDVIVKMSSGPHLLGLARYCLIDNMPPHLELGCNDEDMFRLSSSAVELSEMGIKLTPTKNTWFADMDLSSKTDLPLFGELSLTPLFLNDVTACWLVNMVALEACCSKEYPGDGFVVSSYLSLLAMLMDKEEDVHELRAKHIVDSFFSDQELLAFFKGLARHLRLGERYFAMIKKIRAYKRDRRAFIVVHKFFYHNLKIIVTLLSIAGVLVGIFKVILSLKQT